VYANMELWSEIRRRVLTGEISKREACKHYQIHWKTLVKILSHEEPPGYRRVQPPRRPTIESALPVIRTRQVNRRLVGRGSLLAFFVGGEPSWRVAIRSERSTGLSCSRSGNSPSRPSPPFAIKDT
jgi:hypothetical protein